jgi:hypothetical protein
MTRRVCDFFKGTDSTERVVLKLLLRQRIPRKKGAGVQPHSEKGGGLGS